MGREGRDLQSTAPPRDLQTAGLHANSGHTCCQYSVRHNGHYSEGRLMRLLFRLISLNVFVSLEASRPATNRFLNFDALPTRLGPLTLIHKASASPGIPH